MPLEKESSNVLKRCDCDKDDDDDYCLEETRDTTTAAADPYYCGTNTTTEDPFEFEDEAIAGNDHARLDGHLDRISSKMLEAVVSQFAHEGIDLMSAEDVENCDTHRLAQRVAAVLDSICEDTKQQQQQQQQAESEIFVRRPSVKDGFLISEHQAKLMIAKGSAQRRFMAPTKASLQAAGTTPAKAPPLGEKSLAGLVRRPSLRETEEHRTKSSTTGGLMTTPKGSSMCFSHRTRNRCITQGGSNNIVRGGYNKSGAFLQRLALPSDIRRPSSMGLVSPSYNISYPPLQPLERPKFPALRQINDPVALGRLYRQNWNSSK